MQFHDRREAGRLLGQKLANYAISKKWGELVVLALPRGGVPVGYEVALALRVPLEVFLVRKLGLPGNPELAMGAIASGGACVLNQELLRDLSIPPELLQLVINQEQSTLKQREASYGILHRTANFCGKTAILVDDGAATGATLRAAIQALRQHDVKRIVVAVPTAASHAVKQLQKEADEVITLIESDLFASVGQWYRYFDQTTDEEVLDLLRNAEEALKD
jgi:predicted phosphoribosyltransferase